MQIPVLTPEPGSGGAQRRRSSLRLSSEGATDPVRGRSGVLCAERRCIKMQAARALAGSNPGLPDHRQGEDLVPGPVHTGGPKRYVQLA